MNKIRKMTSKVLLIYVGVYVVFVNLMWKDSEDNALHGNLARSGSRDSLRMVHTDEVFVYIMVRAY